MRCSFSRSGMGVRPSPRVRMMLCTFFRNGELRLQGSCRRLEGGYAGGDVVAHAVLVKVVHLFLNGTIDTRVTRMQAYDEFSLVIELLHHFKLFLQIHGSGAEYGSSGLGTESQLPGNETAGIQNEVGAFQHLGVRVRKPGPGRPGRHPLFRCGPGAQFLCRGRRPRYSSLLSFWAPAAGEFVCTQQGGGFADAGGTHVLHDGFTGMGHLYLCQFLGCIEVDRELLLERFHYRFVTFGFNRGDGGDALGHDAVFLQRVHNLFLHFPYRACQPGKADAEVYDTGHVAYH